MEDAAKDDSSSAQARNWSSSFKMIDGRPTTLFQVSAAADLTPTDLAEDVRREIIALTEMGFGIEACTTKSPRASTDRLQYSDALHTADNVITFKFAAKTIALMRGLHASHGKAHIRDLRSGMHTNCSLQKTAKRSDPDAQSRSQRPVSTSSAGC